MTNFVYYETSAPDGKSDLHPSTDTPAKYVTVAEWNAVMQAIKDLRDAILAGHYHGLTSDPAVTVSGAVGAKIRNNAGLLQASMDAGTFHTIAEKNPGVYNVKSFGAVGDGVTDDLDAFNAAILAMSTNPDYKGRILFVPPGTYRFSDTLVIHRQMILQGANGWGDNASTILLFNAAKNGVFVTRGGGGLGAGDWSVIKDLSIVAVGKTTDADGIVMHARAKVENCFINGFKRYGIFVDSGGVDDNANNFRIDNCRIIQCGSHGIFTQGENSNAGLIVGIDCSSNNGWAFYDNSYLGNTYIGCHAANCTLGGYKMEGPLAANVLVGCYSESGMSPSECGNGCIALGGTHGSGFSAGSGLARLFPPGAAGGVGGLSIVNYPQGAGTVAEYGAIGTIDPNTGAHLTFWTSANNAGRLYFGNRPPGVTSQKGTTEWMTWNNSDVLSHRTRIAFARASVVGSSPHAPRQVTTGSSLLIDPFLGLGDAATEGSTGTGIVRLAARDAFPTSGTWHVGDMVHLANPVAGFSEGWRCTVAGTLGTYSEGRTATADGSITVTLSAASNVLFIGDKLTINSVTGYITNVDVVTGGCATLTMSSAVTAGSGLAIVYAAPTFQEVGHVHGGIPDATGSPGAATQNTRRGRVAIAVGARSVVVTNNRVTTSSVIHATLQSVNGRLTQVLSVVPDAGSFTIRGNANATVSAVNVCWSLEE